MKTLVEKRSYWMYKQLINKYMGIEERFLWWVGELQPRTKRLGQHIVDGVKSLTMLFRSAGFHKKILNWWGLLFLHLAELAGIGEVYQTFADFFKFNTRPLSARELSIVSAVFGEAISYELVRLDEASFLGPKQFNIIYVGFHTINSWGKMPDYILVHEMVHVWQYEQLGAKYMPMALAAQTSEMRYNYGGVSMLQMNMDKGLKAFNLEQQADIIMDYYRIKNGYTPRWGKGDNNSLTIYEQYVNEIRYSS